MSQVNWLLMRKKNKKKWIFRSIEKMDVAQKELFAKM